MPGLPLLNIGELKAGALVICGVEPKYTSEHLFGIPEPAEAPQAEAIAVEAAEERTVVYAAPGEKTANVLTEGELADLDAYIVVTDCRVGIAGESEVSQVGMGVETAEIGLKDIHEHTARSTVVARLFQFDGLQDRVSVWVVEIFFWSTSPSRIRLGPF